MSAPCAENADFTTDGTKRSNYNNLKNLRKRQRSTKSQYKCIPRATRRAHAKLAAADQTAVTHETLVFVLYRPSCKIPGGWLGDELDFARQKAAAAAGAHQGQFNPLLAQSRKPYYPALVHATTADQHATFGHPASVPELDQRYARRAADKHHAWIAAKGPLTQPCVTKKVKHHD